MKKISSLLLMHIIGTAANLQSAQQPSESAANTPPVLQENALDEGDEGFADRRPLGSRQGLEAHLRRFSARVPRPGHTRRQSTASHVQTQQAPLQAAAPEHEIDEAF